MGDYVYFEIFHLIFDHPWVFLLWVKPVLFFFSSPTVEKISKWFINPFNKNVPEHLICIQHQCQDLQDISAPQSLVLCVYSSTPTKKKKIKHETGGFHLLLKNMNRNSIPAYLQIPLSMIWGRGQAWRHLTGTGVAAVVSRAGPIERKGALEKWSLQNVNVTASNSDCSPEENEQPWT